MELVRFMPLYYVAMPHSIIIVTKGPFVSAPITIICDIRSRPHIPKGTKFVNFHEDFFREVNFFFVN